MVGVADTGISEVRLQIGGLGINHAEETSANAFVVFGGSSEYVYTGATGHRQGTYGIDIGSGPGGIDPADLIIDADISLPGDFNEDGRVNLADYTVWRNTLGSSGAGLAADGDNSGTIDANDYNVWKTNFGLSAVAGLEHAEHSTVPEPRAATLLLLAGASTIILRAVVPFPLPKAVNARRAFRS